ncbi:MAG TPA: LysR family transcriptional regulator [Methylomusa anaerophila]|uniref:HTH-type transcriptional regulator CysL n=1 Tax=Methylomusa anaerophila TaxID=1930071 RepID=A0A348AF12_9FIRM|nr:LysR family transcriptional regulator [Methylomusa anaerophila]BBB89660.1 HTH-type transcriptional regulator CysL [Methylomusa anaerophila]HML89564.1 LysR family transcriptional regulator [Methylomusa anaerophila]
MLDVQLKIFKTIVEQNSFSKAAEVLHMTQSAVSQQIQHLEDFYDVKLFDRFYRRIHATPAGEALYPYAVHIDRLYQEAERMLQEFAGDISGRLHLGASLTIGEYVLPEILVAFQQQYPRVDIAMEVCNTEEVVEKVRDGILNVGFVEGPFLPSDHLICQPCGGDSLVVIAAGAMAQPEPATKLVKLMQEKWVMREPTSGTRRVFEEFLRAHDCEPSALHIVMELGSTQAIKEAVKAGLGISVVSRRAVSLEFNHCALQAVQLTEGEITRPFSLVYHKDKFRTYTVETFLAFALSKLNVQQPNE